MRLQVSIRRHALPVVNIIFTTGTGPASKTIAPNAVVTDLLHDINDLVPLESADGEWGLEDYVVEVQATADQETFYECLHYQTIHNVLREDDEVVIRSLGTEDLRSRRLGGRQQISGDGRHLIDGVAFGRQWLRKGGRPAINIPPRKRRRLAVEGNEEELDEESTTLLEQVKQLGYGNKDSDESDENDDDFVEEADDEEVDENRDSKEQSDDDEEYWDMTGAGLELSDELKALLVEAEELSDIETYDRLPSEATQSPRKRKRKREVGEDDESEFTSAFESFSATSKSPEKRPLPVSPVSSVSSSEDTTSSSESDSDSDDAVDHTDTSSSGTSESGDSSSIDTSDRDSNVECSADDSSSNSSSEDDAKLKEKEQHSSSPAKQKSSQAHSTTKSSESISNFTSPVKRLQAAPGQGLKVTKENNLRARKRVRLARLKQDGMLPQNANFADMAALEEQAKARETASGEVQLDHQGDLDDKKTALIQQLDLEEETAQDTMGEVPTLVENNSSFVGAVRQDQAANKEDLSVDKEVADAEPQPATEEKRSMNQNELNEEHATAEDIYSDESLPSQEIAAMPRDSPGDEATPKPAEKRAKLDLASSRRMLFNSLGLRTPKTPEDEQALREKLAQNVRKLPQRKREERDNGEYHRGDVADNDMDSWKDRIVLSAVECEFTGVKLSTPPFPFKQGWDSSANMRRGAGKQKGQKQSKYYDQSNDYAAQSASDLSIMQDQNKSNPSEELDTPESRTLSLEEQVADDMPIPSDFGSLSNLSTADLVSGAVIAFQELEIENFQPVISGYRVARLRDVRTEGSSEIVELLLSRKDWPADRRGSDPFAIEDEEKRVEDGVRVRRHADLIEPKLVEAAPVQAGATPAQIPGQFLEDSSSTTVKHAQMSVVPESDTPHEYVGSAASKSRVLAVSHVEVSNPRRNMITAISEEAGFDSAIDQNLLQPEADPKPEHGAQGSPAFHTRSRRSQQSSHSPVPAGMHAITTGITESKADSASLLPLSSDRDSELSAPSQMNHQNTVAAQKPEYQSMVSNPALSQSEHESSSVPVTNDSSFQDAQRISQLADVDASNLGPALDTSNPDPEQAHDSFEQNETQRLLGIEVQQTQSSSPSPSSKAATENLSARSSFLGHGLDGQVSSGKGSSINSENSSLPSLQEPKSSHKREPGYAARRSRTSSPATASTESSIIVLASKTKPSRKGKQDSAKPKQRENDTGIEQLPEKSSQSQSQRTSETSAEKPGIDLTSSSNSVVPGNDGQNQARRRRKAKGRKSKQQQ